MKIFNISKSLLKEMPCQLPPHLELLDFIEVRDFQLHLLTVLSKFFMFVNFRFVPTKS